MWQIFLCAGLAFLILEMFTPAMFFLNFAISAFVCAVLSLITSNIPTLVVVFCVLSVILIFTLRPLLMRKNKDEKLNTGMESKYVGKTVKVIEDIDNKSGAVTIYDERWQARNLDEGTIPAGETVKIESYESLIMYVRKV